MSTESVRPVEADTDQCKRCGMSRAMARAQTVNLPRCIDGHWCHAWTRALAKPKVYLQDVIEALESAYHPQNPLSMHPADFIRKRFKAPGHEGLVEV